MTACYSPPIVYSSADSDEAHGELKPLRELLPRNDNPVRLFFVHGVGDHCPGYALDPTKGWLNDDNAAAIGLTPVAPEKKSSHFINVKVFMKGEKDQRAGVNVASREFTLQTTERARPLKVKAIEITWSSLTQWLKSNQLGYDSPSAFGNSDGCIEPIDPKIPPTVQAPRRLVLDRLIKEQVFDRNLSDAILYAGSYRETMEKGLAEGVCYSITPTSGGEKCSWSSQESTNSQYTNIFVTHSLGSRMIYDMFLDLLDQTIDSKTNPFLESERSDARKGVEQTIAATPAFYMMANQLSLLGLANVPAGARSNETGALPFADERVDIIRMENITSGSLLSEVFPGGNTDNSSSTQAPAPKVFGNVLLGITAAKRNAEKNSGKTPSGLQIVSFNDTNDLLTWHIPRWYANDIVTPEGRPRVSVTNVFVQNTPKLLFVELPTRAHSGYFDNPSVLNVIRCGASDGKVMKCP